LAVFFFMALDAGYVFGNLRCCHVFFGKYLYAEYANYENVKEVTQSRKSAGVSGEMN